MDKDLFCTLFDFGYLTRGLALIESLREVLPGAGIAVFCFDDQTYRALTELALPGVIPVRLEDLEAGALRTVKDKRTRQEYCWTSTPFAIEYCLEKLGAKSCTYLDADMMFFASPLPAFAEDPAASALITEHRYTPEYDQTAISGKYCVQFMYFRADSEGLRVLRWWRDACLDWCHARPEDGKFGDQKYLDDWLTRFTGVHSVAHEGIGAAPWNIQRYRPRATAAGTVELAGASGGVHPLIFYHFHGLKLFSNDRVDLCAYRISAEARDLIYAPYLRRLLRAEKLLLDRLGLHAPRPAPLGWKELFKRYLKRTLNYHHVDTVLLIPA